MFGGSPTMAPMTYAQPYPGQQYYKQPAPGAYQGQQYIPPPAPAYANRQPQASWNPAQVQQPSQPRPIFRAQAEDEPTPARPRSNPRPAPLSMPSPEELGVLRNRVQESQAVDWTGVHVRLNQLGAICFHEEKSSPGTFRINCLLPTAQAGRMHHIEVQADSEAGAVRALLAKAEEWAGSR